MNALNAADSADGDFALVSSSDGSEVECLMQLLRAQVRQAGVTNLGGAPASRAEAGHGVLPAEAAVGESVSSDNTAGTSGIFADQQVFEGGSKPESLEMLVQQLASAFGREAGASAVPQLQGGALQLDFEGGGHGGFEAALLDIDHMCEELDRRASP